MKNKVYETFEDAVKGIKDGSVIMMHYFGGPGGTPQNLIWALRDQGARDLVIIVCSAGAMEGVAHRPPLRPYVTPNLLVESGQVRKVISTWVVRNTSLYGGSGEVCGMENSIRTGKIEWEPTSQGVLAERIRAGGAGIGGFYSPVGIGTVLERGKEKRLIDGKEYLLEKPLIGDYGFVKAYRSDRFGNLVYRGTSRSFNPLIATACRVTIAEVSQIVEPGELDPEQIVTPEVFVDRIVEIPAGAWT